MAIDVKVPMLPESVADATVSNWYKQPGDTVQRDENLVDLETDKVMLEVPAPESGILKSIVKEAGATVGADEVIAVIEPQEVAAAAEKPAETAATATKAAEVPAPTQAQPASSGNGATLPLTPAVKRLAAAESIETAGLRGSGKGGRLTTMDLRGASTGRVEKRVPMTRLRARIAERLLAAQQEAAILTTFNDVNLQAVMDLRAKYKTAFEKQYGVKLGFMSFFVKAAVEALKRFPSVNASIDGNDVVYHGFFDIGVAVSTDRGLVVPIIRDADKLSMAEIELKIIDFGQRAKAGKLDLEEMTGGTFTVSNGGVFGSLLSTPILNPPQSAILGMHKIEERVIVENGQMVIRPMMYLAMSYDHRIIDGKESVTFLRTIKEFLEEPSRILLGI